MQTTEAARGVLSTSPPTKLHGTKARRSTIQGALGTCEDVKMNVQEIEVPTILTPRVLARIELDINDDFRREARDLLIKVIETCFRPFGALEETYFRDSYHDYVMKYGRHRIELISLLMRAIDGDENAALMKIIEHVTSSLSEYDWSGMGVQAATIRKCIERYKASALKMISSETNIWPDREGHPAWHLAFDLIYAATNIDYCLTAIFLGGEHEIKLVKEKAVFLMAKLMSYLEEFEQTISAITGDKKQLERYFWKSLDRGKFVLSVSENQALYSDNVKPVKPTEGEPISEIMKKDRR